MAAKPNEPRDPNPIDPGQTFVVPKPEANSETGAALSLQNSRSPHRADRSAQPGEDRKRCPRSLPRRYRGACFVRRRYAMMERAARREVALRYACVTQHRGGRDVKRRRASIARLAANPSSPPLAIGSRSDPSGSATSRDCGPPQRPRKSEFSPAKACPTGGRASSPRASEAIPVVAGRSPTRWRGMPMRETERRRPRWLVSDQVGVFGDLAPAIFERSQIFDAVALHRLEQSLEERAHWGRSCANILLAKRCVRWEFRPHGPWRPSQRANLFTATASCLGPC